jgi:Flp pilus assembly protein TadD
MYIVEGAHEKAIAVVQPALERYPTEPSLLEIRGRAQLAAGDHGGAVGTFRTLVDAQPQNLASAQFLLAQALAGTGRTDAVQTELEATLKSDPTHDEARLVLARLLIREGKLEAAEQRVSELGKTLADDPAKLEVEGDLRMAQRRVPDAVRAYERAAGHGRTEIRVVKLAAARWAADDKDAAIGDLKSWLAAYPDSQSAMLRLGLYYVSLNRLEEARKEFTQLAQRVPNSWVPQNELALILLQMGNAPEALASARRASELAPGNPFVMDTLGMVHLALNEPARAVPLLQSARQRAPENREIAVNLAKALAGTGRRDEAAEILHQVLRDDAPFRTRGDAEALLKQLGG